MKKIYLLLLLAALPIGIAAYTLNRVSVHDPSVVKDLNSNYYYIFGSFRKVAKTTDMMNWEEITLGTDPSGAVGVPWKTGNSNNAPSADAFTTPAVTKVTVGGVAKDLPAFDAKAWSAKGIPDPTAYDITGNLWAPDVVWNPTMKKWCMYMSVNGENWYSSIVLLTADNIEGPYEYQAPVVISGFSADNYTETDLQLVLGDFTKDQFPSRYASPWASTGKPSYPNNIDACVFYDETGKLWMSYGSWSGGIFMLELDENTGLRDYNVSYGEQSDTSDPYFGKKIAGGYYVSGEASYIEFINGYYYLFLSYGGLQAGGKAGDNNYGGYQMRVFRSENPDGPYMDPQGASAIYPNYMKNFGANSTSRGENIFGAYGEWGYKTKGIYSERSQGHNSIIAAPDGRTYLIYHTRYQNRFEFHEVRVHQVFQNEDGWLVAAPFEYTGETVTSADISSTQQIATADIPGHYKLLIHRDGLDHTKKDMVTPVEIVLKSDGTITGAYSGTWTKTEGKSYVQIALGSTTYKGVMVEQTMEPTSEKVVAFTAMSNSDGINIWGHKYTPADNLPTPVYFNDFSSTEGLTVVGNGEFIEDADIRFGMIYHNDPNLSKAIRTNYLKLPSDVLMHSASSKEMTISFWVNKKNAVDYYWAPLFTAYGSTNGDTDHTNNNSTPFFYAETRGVLGWNSNGWCNFTAEQNDAGSNTERTDWSDDGEWHLYTMTFTASSARIYIDGAVLNSWTIADNGLDGLFTQTNLVYVCLGGNQAWGWNDLDPAFGFDDFAVYDKALSAAQIAKIMEAKYAGYLVYSQDFETAQTTVGEAGSNFGISGATLTGTAGAIGTGDPIFGQYYINNNGASASTTRQNYLTLATTAFADAKAAGNKELTISFWLNPYTANTANITSWAGSIFVAYNRDGNAAHNSTFGLDTRACFAVHSNCNNSEYYYDASPGLCGFTTDWLKSSTTFANSWHHIALVYAINGTTVNIRQYIDGTLQQTFEEASNGAKVESDYWDQLTEFVIGGNSPVWEDPDNLYAYDEIKIFSKALTATQIEKIIAEKYPMYGYSVVASYGGHSKTLATGSEKRNEGISVAYPRYILNGTTLYEAAAQPSDYYHKSFTLTSDNQVETITYNKSKTSHIHYYAEGEDVLPNSANTGGASSRTSMGAVGRNASGNSSTYTDVTLLPAGTWQIGTHFYCGNTSGTHTANVKVGNDVRWTKTFANGESGSYEYVSETFELTESATLSVAVDGGNATGIDWIYVKDATPYLAVGNTDKSTPENGASSPDYTLKKGDTKVFTFQNYGQDYGKNWRIIVKEGTETKSITRSDFYDAKNGHLDTDGNDSSDDWALMSTDGGSSRTNVIWERYTEDMADARVVATVTYSIDGALTINAVSTGEYNGYKYYVDNVGHVTGTGDLTVNLSVNESWLEILSVEQTAVGVKTTGAGKGFATLYTDKALDFSSATGLTAYTATLNDNTVTLTKVNDIPAGTGVVLKSDNTNEDIVYSLPVVSHSSTERGNLAGKATEATAYNEYSGYDLYMLALNNEGKAQFTKVTEGTVAAGKAYLKIPSGNEARILSVSFGDDITGINSVNSTKSGNGQIFNLAGQRITRPAKGLYIVNGKKKIVK